MRGRRSTAGGARWRRSAAALAQRRRWRRSASQQRTGRFVRLSRGEQGNDRLTSVDTTTHPHDLRRPYLRQLQAMEEVLMRAAVADPSWLAPHDEAALRWALSLARISAVNVLSSE